MMTIESVHEILQEFVDTMIKTAETTKQQYEASEEGSIDRVCYKVINNAVSKAALIILKTEMEFDAEMMMGCLKVIHEKTEEEES